MMFVPCSHPEMHLDFDSVLVCDAYFMIGHLSHTSRDACCLAHSVSLCFLSAADLQRELNRLATINAMAVRVSDLEKKRKLVFVARNK